MDEFKEYLVNEIKDFERLKDTDHFKDVDNAMYSVFLEVLKMYDDFINEEP